MKHYLLSILLLFAIGYTRAQSHVLWGLTYGGGANSAGTIFSFNTGTGLPTSSCSFETDTNGYRPNSTLLEATNGLLYGVTYDGGDVGIGTIFSYDVNTAKEQVLYSFKEGADGESPDAALIQTNDSMLYGVTYYGGPDGNGVLFSYDILSGKEIGLHGFAGDSDALSPIGQLFQLNDSLLLGLSTSGGSKDYGAIYEYNILTGNESVVHSFGSTDTDGRYSTSTLIKASNGVIYGTTYAGGRNNAGTIFSFNPSTGVESVLYSFGGSFNGVSPYSALIQVTDSDLYGVTYEGGHNSAGSIYKFNIYTQVVTRLHDFGYTTDGVYPYYGPLFNAGNNLLYGMTNEGGANGFGIIFSYNIVQDTEIDVYDFASGAYGESPKGGLIGYQTVTGAKQLSVNSNQLSVYPNPTSDFIHTSVQLKQTSNLQLRLVNMLGQSVWSADAGNVSSYQNGISVADLADGVYLLEMVTGSGTQSKEIVVTH